MFGAAGRLIAVVFGFVMAVCVSALVAFRLGIERVTGALHGDEDPFGTVLGWLARGAHLSLYVTLLLAILVVIAGEVARIRTALFYIVGGGIAVAAAPVLIEVQRSGVGQGLPAFIWQVFATAGFVGGGVYWLIAGRRA